MKKTLFAALFLCALGAAIGGVNAGNPTSEHWSLHVYLPGVLGSADDMRHFRAPVFEDEDSVFVVTVGPLHPLLLWMYNHFSFGHPAIAWIKGLATGLMLSGAFLALLSMGIGLKPSFAAACLAAFSPPVVYSTWKVTQETNVIAVALFFFSIVFFTAIRERKSAAANISLLILFLAFAITAALVKDSIKGYMPVFFLMYIFFQKRRDGSADRWQKIAALVFIVSVAAVMFYVRQPSMKPVFMSQIMPESGLKVAAYFTLRNIGLLINALVQFGFCFHASAALLICAGFRDSGRLTRNSFAALALLWAAPAVSYFGFHGMVIYPLFAVFSSAVATALMVVALYRLSISRDPIHNLFAAISLYGLLLVVLVTTAPFSMRDDASPRYFLAILPFISALVVEAYNRAARGFVRTLLAVSVVFFMASYFYNTAMEFRNFDRVELAGKRYLAGRNMSDSITLYSNELAPVYQSDLLALGAGEDALHSSRFMLFEPFKIPPALDRLKTETCMKALGLSWKLTTSKTGVNSYKMSIAFPDKSFISPKKDIYFYEIYLKSLDRNLSKAGDIATYAGYEIFAPRILSRSGFMASRGYWERSAPDVASKYYFGDEPDFSPVSSDALNPEYEYSRTFYVLPLWLESIPVYAVKGLDIFRKVEARTQIRRTSSADIGCEKNVSAYLNAIDEKIRIEKFKRRPAQ